MYLKQKDKRLGNGQTNECIYVFIKSKEYCSGSYQDKKKACIFTFFATKNILFIFGSINYHVINILNHKKIK